MELKEKIRKKGQMQKKNIYSFNQKENKSASRNNANSVSNHNYSINNISYGNNSDANRTKWIIKQSSRSKNSK